MADKPKLYDVSEFKPSYLKNTKVPLGAIIQGLMHNFWKFEDLPKDIQDDVRERLQNRPDV